MTNTEYTLTQHGQWLYLKWTDHTGAQRVEVVSDRGYGEKLMAWRIANPRYLHGTNHVNVTGGARWVETPLRTRVTP